MVTSPVRLPPGRHTTGTHVLPPSVETKIGPLPDAAGSGVNADAAMRRGSAGSTAMFGSLSRWTSALIVAGMTFTTVTATASLPPHQTTQLVETLPRLVVERVERGEAAHAVPRRAVLLLVLLEQEDAFVTRRELRRFVPVLV